MSKLPDIMLSDVIGSWANLNSLAEVGALVALDEYSECDSGYSDLFYASCEEAGLDADSHRIAEGAANAAPLIKNRTPLHGVCSRAEAVGFEPTDPCGSPDFESGPL